MAVEEKTQRAITQKKGKATPGAAQSQGQKCQERAARQHLDAALVYDGRLFRQCAFGVEQGFLAEPGRYAPSDNPLHQCHDRLAIFLGILAVIWSEFMRIGLNPGNAWMLLAVIVAMVGGAFFMIRRGSI